MDMIHMVLGIWLTEREDTEMKHNVICTDGSVLTVTTHETRDGFYATASKLGCGKDASTRHAAVRRLVNDHAYMIVSIIDVE